VSFSFLFEHLSSSVITVVQSSWVFLPLLDLGKGGKMAFFLSVFFFLPRPFLDTSQPG